MNFKAQILISGGKCKQLVIFIDFPVIVGLKKEEEEKKKEKAPHPKLEGNILFDFIKMLHGSYWSIRKIREKFQTPHPEISARLIKKKVPEIAQKEKKEKDARVK